MFTYSCISAPKSPCIRHSLLFFLTWICLTRGYYI
jgi:hypothetical protein